MNAATTLPTTIVSHPRPTPLRHWFSRVTDAHILFPAIALVVLAMIWVATYDLVTVERIGAERAAVLSSRELAETYEAQAIRALHDIDQTLKVVKYVYEAKGERSGALKRLKIRSLLPADLLFVVSIADDKGDVVASSRALDVVNVAGEDVFQAQRQGEGLVIGRPQISPRSGEWKLRFSRRLDDADGRFAGIALLSVDAAYFVSSYESSELGNHGFMGLAGSDGVFRARRSGDTVSAGDAIDYAATVPASETESAGMASTNVWDGVLRYTTARRLNEFPLAVIVGLSADERLEASRRNIRDYVWRAIGGSVLVLALVALLGRLSRQLALTRAEAVEAQLAHSERVEYLAYHDGLTMLPNRSLFSKLLEQSITQAHRHNRHLSVLFLDLDRFKHINDTLGHEAGDHLLQEVARRLAGCLRDSDAVARLGGDEFVVLLPELTEDKYAATVAQKILAAVARPFILLGQEFRITASVGISVYPQDGLDEQTLTKNADRAMYHAKEEGKNNFQFYSEQRNASSLERLSLESSLRHALERNEFRLHYQAKQDIRTGRITGMEALLRWQHPDLGMVAPMQFIPIAEETGLIVPIGRWVLRTACLQNTAWQKQGLPHLSIAVNLTARQFYDENLLADVAEVLAASGMEPHLLELEITESLLMRDVERTLRILTLLKAMGIRMAVDDFGIGYSSLSTIKRFPLDTIKIDRSLIRDIASVAEDKDLTGAIFAMSRALSLTVVAQGVETREQADFLRDNACDEFQGFYFNRPLQADQMAKLLRVQANHVDGDILAADVA